MRGEHIPRRVRDLRGQTFDRLTVVEYVGTSRHQHALWRCSCSCGGEKVVAAGNLQQGYIRSCGCLARETKVRITPVCAKVPRSSDYEIRDTGFGAPCWVWRKAVDQLGYARLRDPERGQRGVNVLAHRLYYEWAKGRPIPYGLVLDHICRNPPCVNPAHLEAVTSGENTRRGEAGWNMRMKTCCPQGHPYDRVNSKGARSCTICQARHSREACACKAPILDPSKAGVRVEGWEVKSQAASRRSGADVRHRVHLDRFICQGCLARLGIGVNPMQGTLGGEAA